MPTKPLTDEQCREVIEAYEQFGEATKAADYLGMSRNTFNYRYSAAKARNIKTIGFQPVSLPSENLPVQELLERRKKQFQHKQKFEEATKLIPINVTLDGPIGVLHFGDPHVDDDGTDIIRLERDVEIVKKTEGLFGANIGDTTNNWVGRLGILYGEQSTSMSEARQLAEWFLSQFRWLYMIGGNHDLWPGHGDLMGWIARTTQSLYKPSEVRIALRFPNGESVRINARHDFAGGSIYNPAHGVMKALTWGVRDHLAICGHKHVSGYGVMKDPDSGIAMHALQISSYKLYDRYAKEKGFRDQTISPCAVTVIDPYLPQTHPDLVKVFWDAEEGAEYLTYKRQRWARK